MGEFLGAQNSALGVKSILGAQNRILILGAQLGAQKSVIIWAPKVAFVRVVMGLFPCPFFGYFALLEMHS